MWIYKIGNHVQTDLFILTCFIATGLRNSWWWGFSFDVKSEKLQFPGMYMLFYFLAGITINNVTFIPANHNCVSFNKADLVPFRFILKITISEIFVETIFKCACWYYQAQKHLTYGSIIWLIKCGEMDCRCWAFV